MSRKVDLNIHQICIPVRGYEIFTITIGYNEDVFPFKTIFVSRLYDFPFRRCNVPKFVVHKLNERLARARVVVNNKNCLRRSAGTRKFQELTYIRVSMTPFEIDYVGQCVD